MRILYRIRQFWRAVSIKKDHPALEQALAFLNPEQRVLFTQMHPSEQSHAVIIYRRLLEQGENQPDLLVAALLHDVGKLRHCLSPLERAMAVLFRTVLPKQAHRWAELPRNGWDNLPSWRKAFIVAEYHARWGAEMARQVGVSPLTEYLIRFHQRSQAQDADANETSLLHKLWLVDNES